MFIKRNIVVVLFALMVVGFVSACGSALKESGGDQTGAGGGLAQTATYVGLQNCYTCHNQTKFNQWAKSRHANFDLGDGTRIDYSSMEAIGSTSGTTYGYDKITGDPGAHLAADGTDRCAPCHTGPDYGGDILDINAGGDVFTNPNIGEVNRSIIDCEACHGGGSFHYGVGALPYPVPGYAQCTVCHADAATEHHSRDSKYSWANSVGISFGSGNGPAITSTANGITVWTLPAHSGTAWTGSWDGPYYYSGDHTINDTHFNEYWIAGDDMLTQYVSANAKLGYVDTSNSSPNSGMANANSKDSCTASCHAPHEFDLTINLEWAKSGHHPIPEGPLTAGAPSGPANWGAIEHNFSSACVRCHTAYGFAAVAPDSAGDAPTSVPVGKGAYITCNACHNGVDYPSAANLRLRFTGVISLFDHDGAVADSVNANNSAVCSYCHQGRSTGQYIKNNYATALSTANFGGANSHYLAAAGILFRSDARPMGYEYVPAGSTTTLDYSNSPDFEHIKIGIGDWEGTGDNGPCVSCHMHDTSDGHANHLYTPFKIDANGDPIDDTPADFCTICHNGVGEPVWTPTTFAEQADGFADALGILEDELGVQTTPIYYNPLAYPYFYLSAVPAEQTYGNAFKDWPDEQTLGAAFNLNLLTKEPGAFAHNSDYARRLIFDSIDFLNHGSVVGTIPDYSSSHPDGVAWLEGTTRP
ncbi:doubled CXXCH motif [bacterium BMS3Abin14]|nr:doubled CXXCH motif [bacterium BMS3Abin14]